MNDVKRVLLFAAAVAVTVGATIAFGAPTLTPLPPAQFWENQAANTKCRGQTITSDGKYIVGYSTGSGYTYNQGTLWDVTDPTNPVARDILAGGGRATVASGVDYRMVNGQPQMIVHGLSAGYPSTWFSNDNGVSFSYLLRDTSFTGSFQMGNSATMRAKGTDDTFYNAWLNSIPGTATTYRFHIDAGSGEPPTVVAATKDTTAKSYIESVSENGIAVGRRSVTGGYAIYMGQGTSWQYLYGLTPGSSLGYGQTISADGTRVGGMSPVDPIADGRTGQWPYVITNPGASQTIVELPTLNPANTGAYVTNGNVYGLSDDGRYAVGMDYTLGMERAVFWDLQTMTEIDLTDFATANGILGDFTLNLRRAYSVGVNENGDPVITGYGINSALLETGFVLVLPEPATVILLALASLLVMRRRR